MAEYPSRIEAVQLLEEALCRNPGPWGNHSRVAAECAGKIAAAAGMDPQKAWVLGLLHDIGRRFGTGHLAHVRDGYRYMQSLGYEAAARICLTHSFSQKALHAYIGKRDIPETDQDQLRQLLNGLTYDDYDRLIQLCDCLAGAEGVVDMEARMTDVERRYGWYPEEKRRSNRALRRYFQEKCGRDIYEIVKEGETE